MSRKADKPVSLKALRGRLFLDMDGVLADFDGGYEAAFGWRPSGERPVDWSLVTAGFFAGLPAMTDAYALWGRCCEAVPTILTAVPHTERWRVDAEKRAWIAGRFGPEVRVLPVLWRQKAAYAFRGAVLVDDMPRQQTAWEERGGIFLLHKDAASTIAALEALCQT